VLTAPILSFTAEEAWQALPAGLRGDDESIFDLAFPKFGAVDVPALEVWDMLRALRAQVAAAEGERDFQLDAEVAVPATHLDAFRALGDGLREALVVSSLRGLHAADSAQVKVMRAAGDKCERCWKYLPLGADADHPTLCAPCAAIVRDL
jgi:isoleucyl-tRNA synthetase